MSTESLSTPEPQRRAELCTPNPIHLMSPDASQSAIGAGAGPEAPTRAGAGRLRRAVTATTAALGACVMVAGLAAPLLAQPQQAGASGSGAGFALAAAAPAQHLSGTGGTALGSGERAFDAVSPIETAPEAKPGSPDLSGLSDSKVRYPFDAQVPLTDPFGYRTAPVAQFHDAQDFAAADGTPIRIIASGVVLEAGQTIDGCGFGLKVQHRIGGRDVTSRYCHMQNDSSSFQVGQQVKIGDTAGRVGATGMAFGAHLHLAMRQDDKPIDPMVFLTKNVR